MKQARPGGPYVLANQRFRGVYGGFSAPILFGGRWAGRAAPGAALATNDAPRAHRHNALNGDARSNPGRLDTKGNTLPDYVIFWPYWLVGH